MADAPDALLNGLRVAVVFPVRRSHVFDGPHAATYVLLLQPRFKWIRLIDLIEFKRFLVCFSRHKREILAADDAVVAIAALARLRLLAIFSLVRRFVVGVLARYIPFIFAASAFTDAQKQTFVPTITCA